LARARAARPSATVARRERIVVGVKRVGGGPNAAILKEAETVRERGAKSISRTLRSPIKSNYRATRDQAD